MSISIDEARRKLDILEQSKSNPELILTSLFEQGVNDLNFMYQITIDGEHFSDYMADCLKSIEAFSECKIRNDGYVLKVEVPTINENAFSEASWGGRDLIAKINLNERTYKLIDKCINAYEKTIAAEPIMPKLEEVETFYKQFEDLTIAKRWQNIKTAVKKNKTLWNKIKDVWFMAALTKRKRTLISKTLENVYKRVDDKNKRIIQSYGKAVANYTYLKEHAPTHIESIKQKQQGMESYLLCLGYVEDSEISDY